ncbi:hypothetical protein IFM89_021434 [Coptis chinensis]|uniref:Major facilitator superfamily (MFS) profile domain-containing protein n=1 Tax=Coptis chinensis TaxID=261450 RepID=A0A835M4B5_9MAGN|nr:hypothetical protein IFM89_021434 [Coptis chinensis]
MTSSDVYIFILGRVFASIGIGLASQVIPRYNTEIAFSKRRKIVDVVFQVSVLFGVALGNILNDMATEWPWGWRIATLGPRGWMSEGFPPSMDWVGSIASSCTNLFLTLVLAQVTVLALCYIRGWVFIIFSVFNLLGGFFVYLFLPETTGRSSGIELSKHRIWRRYVQNDEIGKFKIRREYRFRICTEYTTAPPVTHHTHTAAPPATHHTHTATHTRTQQHHTLHTAHSTLNTQHSALCTQPQPHTLHTALCSLNNQHTATTTATTAHSTLQSQQSAHSHHHSHHSTQHTAHSAHSHHHYHHSTLCTQHCALSTLHTAHSTLNTQPPPPAPAAIDNY